MIRFEGDENFPLPVEEVYAKLADASFLVSCLDHVEEVVEATPDRAVWKVRPPFSFVSGTLDVAMEFFERVPNASARTRLHSRGVGSSATVETAMTLEGTGGGTAVHWTAEVTEITGLMKMVPQGLIQSAAQKVIADVWAGVRRKLVAGG